MDPLFKISKCYQGSGIENIRLYSLFEILDDLNRDLCIKHNIRMFTVIKLVTFRKVAWRICQQIQMLRERLFKIANLWKNLDYLKFFVIFPEKTKIIPFHWCMTRRYWWNIHILAMIIDIPLKGGGGRVTCRNLEWIDDSIHAHLMYIQNHIKLSSLWAVHPTLLGSTYAVYELMKALDYQWNMLHTL